MMSLFTFLGFFGTSLGMDNIIRQFGPRLPPPASCQSGHQPTAAHDPSDSAHTSLNMYNGKCDNNVWEDVVLSRVFTRFSVSSSFFAIDTRCAPPD